MTERFKKFKVTVKLKQPWVNVDSWFEKPTSEQIIESFLEEVEDAFREGKITDIFEILVEETRKNEREV
jgi:hypothetical protein